MDLSKLFVNVAETVYKDNCCHYDELGNRLLAEAIAKAISDASTSAL